MKSKPITGLSKKHSSSQTCQTKSSGLFLPTLTKYFVAVFTVITTSAIFTPLKPQMPNVGLDPSWMFSMNQAVAQKLKFGKEIIFTFGPFASIYSRSYLPATDHLMVFGSLILGLCYAVSLLYLTKDKEPYFLFAFLIFLSAFMEFRDALFISYPLLLAFCASQYITEADQRKKTNLTPWQISTAALVFAPFGLLALVKGSFLLVCGATAVVTSFYFSFNRYRKLALITLISPTAAVIILWLYSGQSLLSLPGYFVGMSQIIFGYTEALAIEGNKREIIYYLLSTGAIIWVLVKSDKITIGTKIFLNICLTLFLFITFKSGFVRDDGHAMIAGSALVIAALITGLVYADKRLRIALLMSIITWGYIDKNNLGLSTVEVFENIHSTYAGAWSGLCSRITDSGKLQNSFEHSLEEIRKVYAIPALQGTTDIYSSDQAYLLASNNQWNPRPVIQSYQVYTPLSRLNEQHLRGNNAPDNVLFNVQPMDGRLPSLEDGLSWPALFDNYTVTSLDNNLAYLRKKQTILSNSAFNILREGTYRTGEMVELPITNAPLFATLDLKLTLLGRILSLVFKPPQLRITLKLKNGTSEDYRVLSNMMDSGFFISPLVKYTQDFVYLATGNQRYLENHRVESFMITPAYAGAKLWSSTYTLELKSYSGKKAYALPGKLRPQPH